MSRLDLPQIEHTLISLAEAPRQEATRTQEIERRESMRRLFEGFQYVDDLLASRVDIFQMGESRKVLEINHVVLCGAAPETRHEAKRHIAETVRYFYETRPGGIGDFADWYLRNRSSQPETLAAGCFVQVVSSPQLFVEGNQRTGLLLMNYILVRAGHAPFVTTVDNAKATLDLFSEIKAIDKTRMTDTFNLLGLQRKLQHAIESHASHGWLRGGSPSAEYRGPVG